MTTTDTGYRADRTLTVRIELIRQLRRRRTLVAALLAVALPLIVVAAVKVGPQSDGGGGFGNGDLDLVGLATSGALNFTVTMLFFASGFLLTILVAMFFGDAVASEASWSTLRYLLAAPVPRRRLLRAKVITGLILTAGILVVLVGASLLIGATAFGSAALTSPVGGTFSSGESLQRLGLIVGSIALSLLVPAGIAFLLSVLTDVPLAAVGTAVIIVIVLNILEALDALGDLRRFLPGHYGNAWVDALAPTISWDQMAVGAAYSLTLFALLVAAAVLRFDRRDITS